MKFAIGWLLLLAPLAPLNSENPAAVEWLKENAVPLVSDDPSVDDRDIADAAAMLDGALLIGAGEATHGTREFFRLKDRLFRELVRNHGVRAIAIEANYAEAEAINAYVQGGSGDAEALIANLGFWTWDTQEVLELILWIRQFNRGRNDQVHFYGTDIQFAPSNLDMALDFLQENNQPVVSWRAPFSEYLAAATDIAAGYRVTNAYDRQQMQVLRGASEDLYQYFIGHESELIAASSKSEFLRAKGAALAAAWYFVMQSKPEAWRFRGFRGEYDVRDRAMADLAKLALEREGAGGRAFLWAHNVHVSKARHLNERMTMGRYLFEELGSKYVSIGFGFDHGGFQAFPPSNPSKPDTKPVLTSMRLPSAPDNYAGAVLRKAGSPIWIADLRKLQIGTAAQGWFATSHPWRWTGALYSDALEAKHPPISLADSHDIIIFVCETSRARPLPNTINRYSIRPDW